MNRFLETVRSEGINHLSYIIGAGGQAAVIDPRRDCKIYVDIANNYGSQITHIFETHRHEDFVVGSLELARRTGAQIHHGRALPFKYGEPVKDGDRFELGPLTLKILETPGHTQESISIAVYPSDDKDIVSKVFTGDTLFVGDTGRIDLNPSISETMAGKMYQSLHQKILPLGDHVIIYPAHSQGAIAGMNISEREISTLGYEKKTNPDLSKKRKDFIKKKLAEEHYHAPYFRQMERLNKDGVQLLPKLPDPLPVSTKVFQNAVENDGLFVLDIRSPEAFAGGHIAGSLNIPLSYLPLYAGWFLPYEGKLGLIGESEESIFKARTFLMRMGFDNILWYLAGGMHAWAKAGQSVHSLPVVDVPNLCARVKSDESLVLLDVRNRRDYENAPSAYSKRIWLGELPEKNRNLPANRKIITLCDDGEQASIAAALLKQLDVFKDVEVCLGSADKYSELLPIEKFHKKNKKKTG